MTLRDQNIDIFQYYFNVNMIMLLLTLFTIWFLGVSERALGKSLLIIYFTQIKMLENLYLSQEVVKRIK